MPCSAAGQHARVTQLQSNNVQAVGKMSTNNIFFNVYNCQKIYVCIELTVLFNLTTNQTTP